MSSTRQSFSRASSASVPPRPRALLIAGATASGKSSLALGLAKKLNVSIINADSMQIYRELQIITARPDAADEAVCPHHLFGHVSAVEDYSTGRWLDDVLAAIAQVEKAGRLPVIVGGTGLYFTALTEGIAAIPDIPDAVRRKVRQRFEDDGLAVCHAALEAVDPAAFQRILPSDKQRTLRALEVYEATGRALSDWHQDPVTPPLAANEKGGLLKILLLPSRDWLYERCDRRFDEMLAAGALAEAEKITALGLAPDRPAMKAVGLPSLQAVIAGTQTPETARLQAQQQTRRYAKRQMTWFRNQMISWNSYSEQEYYKNNDEFLSYITKKGLT